MTSLHSGMGDDKRIVPVHEQGASLDFQQQGFRQGLSVVVAGNVKLLKPTATSTGAAHRRCKSGEWTRPAERSWRTLRT